MIRVVLPSQLDRYTGGARNLNLEAADLGGREEGATLLDVIRALDTRYRGLAFRIVDEQERIRRHVAIFVGENMVRRLDVRLQAGARIQIVGALSGG
ncbi:MoaD/ThiS family protein [Gilvimarinus sp. F26214L]|uniref:MoaD/ThiS family protein n=1 Tax=Gilvimarinus sp. DZF01 TaxID=3461371 RepID=UPI004045B0F1